MADSNQVKDALAALANGKTARSDVVDGSAAVKTADGSSMRERSGRKTGAHQPTEYRSIIERASNATDDIDAAAEFVEEVGVTRLEKAVAEAEREVSGLADQGRAALAAFERFRAAADGDGRCD